MICKVTEFQDHAYELAKEHGVSVEPISPWIKMANSKFAPFQAAPCEQRIDVSDINNLENYIAALHEIGHCVDLNAYALFCRMSDFGRTKTQFWSVHFIDCECYAWEYAIRNSIYEPTDEDYDMMKDCLMDYMIFYPSSNITHPIGLAIKKEIENAPR